MNRYFADLHIHIGRTERGTPVKISGSKHLTFFNVAHEASERKGIDIVGLIDCHSPTVQEEIASCLDRGVMSEAPGGGLRYGRTTVLLGCEIEVRDPGMGPAHLLVYLPTLDDMRSFTQWMSRYMKNVELSSQRIYVPARVLQQETIARGGIMIPAHVFTPHKSVYGSCTDSLAELLDPDGIAAVELGLSSDTEMAGHLSELDRFAFVTNSDAHSLGKIGREYNEMRLAEPSFEEVVKALGGTGGRGITANYGLNPRLGKYHRTYCASCEFVADETAAAVDRCPYCGGTKLVRGVMDRILDIADRHESSVPELRPPYRYQIPLEFIPGLGKRKLDALLARFGTEMNILHRIAEPELAETVGEPIARMIAQARSGSLPLVSGGGGKYGRIAAE